MPSLVVFGDSIPTAAGASSPSKGLMQLFASRHGLTLINKAVSTAMALDETTQLMNTVMQPADKAAVMFGTNDEAKYDLDLVKRGYFINTLTSYVARLACGSKDATDANGVTFEGPWQNYEYGLPAGKAPGAKATFSFTGKALAIGTLRQYGNTGTFRVIIDGIDQTVNGQALTVGGDVRTLLGTPHGTSCFVFDNLGEGQHTVMFEVLTADPSNVVYFHWFSDLIPRNQVAVVNIPHAVNYTYGGSDANVDAYNADIAAMVAKMANIGLSVKVADISSKLVKSDMSDNVHPGDTGHAKGADSLDEAFDLVPTSPTQPGVTYAETKIYAGSDGNCYALLNGLMKKISTS